MRRVPSPNPNAQEIFERLENELRWEELPQIKIGSRLSLSATNWFSNTDSSVFPPEIWRMIGDYVVADLERGVELDRLARPYGVVADPDPKEDRDRYGYYGDGASPWHRKSKIDFRKRWFPLRLYHAIKPLRSSMDDYFKLRWIQEAEIWTRRNYSSLRQDYWVSKFVEFRGREGEYAVFGISQFTNFYGRQVSEGSESERNVAVSKAVHELREDQPGYHSLIFMRIENGMTDLLPTDLEYPSQDNGYSFIFRWRPYIDLLHAHQCEFPTSLVECVNTQYKDLNLEWNVVGYDISMKSLLLSQQMNLEDVNSIGGDGRNLIARRSIRLDLAFESGRLQQCDGDRTRRAHSRYERLDEEHIAFCLLDIMQREQLQLTW